MTDQQVIAHLLYIKSGANPTLYPDIFNTAIEDINKLRKIKEITERALRSSDPINLYKALCINEIAEVLGVKAPDPADKTESKGQITFDDIL